MFEGSQNISHTQAKRENYKKIIDFKSIGSNLFFRFGVKYSLFIPPKCHLSPLEPHWNLIGT